MANETFEGLGADYENASICTSGEKPAELIPGAYILGLKTAHMETLDSGKRKLVLYFDICEGEYTGYYNALYEYEKKFDNQSEGKKAKWKGTLDIWMPDKKDGEELYKSSMSRFKAAITAINSSNPGKPEINPKVKFGSADFMNKIVGGAFGEVEWYFDGRSGWKTKCRWLADAGKVRDGKVTIPNKLQNKNRIKDEEEMDASPDMSDYEEIISDGDLPF